MVAAVALAATELRSRGPVVVPEASRIAVLPFDPVTTDSVLARVGEDIAATVNVTLDRLGGITTVDRFATLTRTAAAAPVRSVEDALALGRRFGAGSVLTGTVARAGDDLRIEATLFRSDRPVPVARATVVAPAESLAVLTDSLTLQLVRQVWLRRGAPTPSLAAVTTRSVAALRSFLDGERAMLAARWREACDDYRAAFDADTGFTLAYARYAEAVTWRRDEHVHDVEPEVRRHLRAGRLRLPERERLLADARLAGDNSSAVRLGLLEEATRRYPDYWPGWLAYGDALVHFGLLHGHSWARRGPRCAGRWPATPTSSPRGSILSGSAWDRTRPPTARSWRSGSVSGPTPGRTGLPISEPHGCTSGCRRVTTRSPPA